MRLVCGVNKCHAQVLVPGAVYAFGTDTRGAANATPTSTKSFKSTTPTQVTLSEIEGLGDNQSEGRATISLPDGSAWNVEVQLATDGSGNVRLIGTARDKVGRRWVSSSSR